MKTCMIESLQQGDPASAVAKILKESPGIYGATIGLDKKPRMRPAFFCYEEGGVLYFATAKCLHYYAELSLKPYLQISVPDKEGNSLLLTGKAVFTEDERIIERCLEENEVLGRHYKDKKEMLIAYFLTEAYIELISETEEPIGKRILLPDPGGVLVGITIKKDNEIRDRLAKILQEREEKEPEGDLSFVKFYDGMLLLFAEAAKKVWPRMDIMPVERAVLYETYDEREAYMKKAATFIGNAVIDKPEDLTEWLNPTYIRENMQEN